MTTRLLQRIVPNMTPAAECKARQLWEDMHDLLEGPHFEAKRDEYHAMFKDDSNFLPGTEPYQSPEELGL